MVPYDEYLRWLQDPVTKALVSCLEDVEQAIADDCGRGGAIPKPESNRTFEQLYFEAQGGLDTMGLFDLKKRPFGALLVNYEHVEPKEGVDE